ncbi:sentrin-specific protease protein [Rutstroemia sp. NJR-2017a WRK4]|nr:sentrin-specific protease protein [Rutstroemia sp. NJR-2017a WRK4]
MGGKPNKPDNDQNLERRIKDTDDFDNISEEINASTSENAQEQEHFPREPDTEEEEADLLWCESIPTLANLLANAKKKGKVSGLGAPKLFNHLGDGKTATAQARTNFHKGYLNFEGSAKRQKVERTSTGNGSSGGPIDLEQDVGSGQRAAGRFPTQGHPYTISSADSSLFTGTSPVGSKSTIQDIDKLVRAAPTTRRSRHKALIPVNGSIGSQLEQHANHRKLHATDLQKHPKKPRLRDEMKADTEAHPANHDGAQMQETTTEITPSKFYGQGEVSRTRASSRSADRPKLYTEPSKPRTPSPERWTRTHPEWAKFWQKSIIYPSTGKKTATVDKQDIERLDEGKFLNDNLIMFYLLWLEQHYPHLADRVYVHNTFFYASLTKTAKGEKGINYEAVQRWTTKVNLPSYDYIIVPVNEHTHWFVAIICNPSRLLESEPKPPTPKTPAVKGRKKPSVPPRIYDPKEPRIITFDSLGIAHSAVCRNLKDYIVAEINFKMDVSITPPKSLGMTAMNIATQNNYCDCGIFLLSYMEEFFARPDALIEDIMQSKYNKEAYNTNPSKLRHKIRKIIFGLQREQNQNAQEARKAKQDEVKSKTESTKDNSTFGPSVSQSASIHPSKSPRPPSAAQPEPSNTDQSPELSTKNRPSAPTAAQSHKNPPEVISLDDSQDNLEHQDDDIESTLVQQPAAVAVEDPSPKELDSPEAMLPSTATKEHPTKSFVRVEIPGSQGESAQECYNDKKYISNHLNSQEFSQTTNTTDQNHSVAERPRTQQSAIRIDDDDNETDGPKNSQRQGGTKGILARSTNFTRGVNPFAPKTTIDNIALGEELDGSYVPDTHQSSTILPEKADIRSKTHMLPAEDSKKRKRQEPGSAPYLGIKYVKKTQKKSKGQFSLVLYNCNTYGLLDNPLFHIPPESQGLPHLNVQLLKRRKKSEDDWGKLEKLQSCAEHSVSVGDSVGLYVESGPARGKILQIRKSTGDEHVQVLVALIWERSTIEDDTNAVRGFKSKLNRFWPPKASFQFMVGTEYRVLTCASIIRDKRNPLGMNIEDRLWPDRVYNRPFDPEKTQILKVGDMNDFFDKNAAFWEVKFGM